MKITSVTNHQNFKKLYINSTGMNKNLQEAVFKIVETLNVKTDAVELLDKSGIDIFIYSNPVDPELSAKIAFADKNLNIYKLPSFPKDKNTDFKNIQAIDKASSPQLIWARNINKILNCIDEFYLGKITQKSDKNPTSRELEFIFQYKN